MRRNRIHPPLLAMLTGLVVVSGSVTGPDVRTATGQRAETGQRTGIAPRTPAALRCAEPFGGLRSAESSFVVAVAREDTVADAVEEPRAKPPGPVTFGQLVDVHRAGGAAVDEIGAAGGSGRAVLVPWGFDEACRPIPWTGSWRWATVGAEGFYRGHVRPRADWIDGRPTLDVHGAVWEGFPVSPWEHPAGTGRRHLSATQLFELYGRLPTSQIVASRPYGAVSELVDWRREAGDLADRYPARTLLTSAFRVAELARLRTSPLSFAGTYRIRVESDGDMLASFVLRTAPVGSQPLGAEGEPSAGTVPSAPAPSPSFAVRSVLVAAETRLDEGRPSPECSRELGLRVGNDGVTNGAAARAWPAELPLRFVTACFRGAAILGELRPPSTAEAGEALPDQAAYFGEFRQEADGRFTFRQRAYLSAGEAVMLTGERIGLEALPSPAVVPAERP